MDIAVTLHDQTISFTMNDTDWSLYFKKRFDLAIQSIFTEKQLSNLDLSKEINTTIIVDSEQLQELIAD